MKLFYHLLGLLLPMAAPAQTEYGRSLWTGSAAVGVTAFDEKQPIGSNSTSPTVSLAFTRGAFIRDNWLLGGGFAGSAQVVKRYSSDPINPVLNRTSTLALGVSVFVRRYWGREHWRVFAGGGLEGTGQVETTKPQITYPYILNRSTTYRIRPITQVGAVYFVSDRIGLEAVATSNAFPFSVNGVGLGLVVLSATDEERSPETVEAVQTAAGRWLVSGGFALQTGRQSRENRSASTGTNTFNLALTPAFGWFVAKNTIIGVQVPVAFSKTATNGQEGTYRQWGLTPFVKHYVSDQRLRPFWAGNLSYLVDWSEEPRMATRTNRIVEGGISAGLAYLLGDRFIVEATLGRMAVSRAVMGPETTEVRTWSVNLSGSLTPVFSILYSFP